MRLDCQVVSWFCQANVWRLAAAGIGGEKDVHANQNDPVSRLPGPTSKALCDRMRHKLARAAHFCDCKKHRERALDRLAKEVGRDLDLKTIFEWIGLQHDAD